MQDNKDNKSEELAHKPISRLLMQFALPSIAAMSAVSIYNVCDSIFLGRCVGPLAIAGLAITFPFMNILAAFSALSTVGASAQTSVRMGMDDQKTAQHIFGNMLRIEIFLGVIFALVGLFYLDPILRLFGASDATLPYAHQYMLIIMLGAIVTHTFQGMAGQLRAVGHPNLAMNAQIGAVILNVILDALFVLVFRWGILGAAVATVLGQFCAWCYCVNKLSNKNMYVHFCKETLKLSWKRMYEICTIGASPFAQTLCGCLIVIFINRALLEQGGNNGDLYVGAYGIVNRIIQLMVMAVVGFSQGLQPIVGFNLGAGYIGRVRKALKQSVIVATVFMTVAYIILALVPDWFAMWFTNDVTLIDFCVPALRITVCTFPVVGSQMIATAFFQSIREGKKAMFISLSRQLIFLLPMLIILPKTMGVYGVWWSMPIADCFSVIASWILLAYELQILKKRELKK